MGIALVLNPFHPAPSFCQIACTQKLEGLSVNAECNEIW